MRNRPFLIGGAVLTALRKARKLKAYELAARAGIDNDVLSQYEVGAKTPTPETLGRLLAPLGCGAEDFEDLVAELAALADPAPADGWCDPTPAQRRRLRRAGRLIRRLGEAELIRYVRRRNARRARLRAVVFVRRLLALPEAERPVVVAHDPEYANWAVGERLCLESEKAAAHKAGQALALAELALRAAERVQPEGPLRACAAGQAWAYVGNARRVSNDFTGAKEAFLRSRELWREGAAGDPYPLEEWPILGLEASLCIDSQDFPRAIECLDGALAAAPRKEIGALLLHKARVFEQQREHEQALALLAEAEPLLDPVREPRYVFGLLFNRAVNLGHLQRFEEAEAILPAVRERVIALRQELDLVRTLWLEGRIAIGLGRIEEGYAILSQVAAEFRIRQLAFDGALVNLDLAVVELGLGQTAQVKQRAAEMWWIFRTGSLQREARTALDLFCQAARQEAATVELARRVLNFLERSQHNPALRFEA